MSSIASPLNWEPSSTSIVVALVSRAATALWKRLYPKPLLRVLCYVYCGLLFPLCSKTSGSSLSGLVFIYLVVEVESSWSAGSPSCGCSLSWGEPLRSDIALSIRSSSLLLENWGLTTLELTEVSYYKYISSSFPNVKGHETVNSPPGNNPPTSLTLRTQNNQKTFCA